jgi:hypothetical protein
MGSLKPTHVQFQSRGDGKSYAKLKDGATWRDGKAAAEILASVSGKPAKPVRRK